jgi:hypothetical protein
MAEPRGSRFSAFPLFAFPLSRFPAFRFSDFRFSSMRFLRNPIVTGILTLVAIAVVFYQFVWPYLSANNSIQPGTSAAPSPPTPTGQRAVAAATALREQLSEAAAPWKGPVIDHDYLEARFAKWVATPKRDPFLLLGTDPKDKSLDELLEPSPVAKWKLNAIWDQTGSRLAVINNAVHQLGDEIAGYKIIRIEPDEVWFQGPHRKERLGLNTRGPVILPNPSFPPAAKNPPNATGPQ